MKHDGGILYRDLVDIEDCKSSRAETISHQRFLDFNAAVGFFIIFSLLFMMFTTVLIVFGLEINVVPFIVALTSASAVGIVFFLITCYRCE